MVVVPKEKKTVYFFLQKTLTNSRLLFFFFFFFVISSSTTSMNQPGRSQAEEGEEREEGRQIRWMQEALIEAEKAYDEGEVPVGCVFVFRNEEGEEKIIGRGHNRTNLRKNATAHAEMEAVDQILLEKKFDANVFRDCELYVSVEPCIMCAGAMLQLGIRRAVFGCSNDRFGGCGSILNVNSLTPSSSSPFSSTPSLLDLYELSSSYPIEKGIMKEEAIRLLRKFYNRENVHAPPTKRRDKSHKGRGVNSSSYSSSSSPVPIPSV
jgi:tRNA-specific adenosine deaminase 2